jgi:hypothetical protein
MYNNSYFLKVYVLSYFLLCCFVVIFESCDDFDEGNALISIAFPMLITRSRVLYSISAFHLLG